MSIDRNTVAKVARLARLKVSEEDLDANVEKLANILKFVEQLDEVDTENVAPLASVVDVELQLRPDAVTDGGIADAVLANAPETLEGFFVVPKVVE